MNGISNVLTAADEVREVSLIKENFDRRIKESGKIPGTHSLGVEFSQTATAKHTPIVDSLVENLLDTIAYAMENVPNWADLAREDIQNSDAKNIRKMMREA